MLGQSSLLNPILQHPSQFNHPPHMTTLLELAQPLMTCIMRTALGWAELCSMPMICLQARSGAESTRQHLYIAAATHNAAAACRFLTECLRQHPSAMHAQPCSAKVEPLRIMHNMFFSRKHSKPLRCYHALYYPLSSWQRTHVVSQILLGMEMVHRMKAWVACNKQLSHLRASGDSLPATTICNVPAHAPCLACQYSGLGSSCSSTSKALAAAKKKPAW